MNFLIPVAESKQIPYPINYIVKTAERLQHLITVYPLFSEFCISCLAKGSKV
jgi:hypothetical protein